MTPSGQQALDPAFDLLAAAAVRESFRPAELLDEWLEKNSDARGEVVDRAVEAALDLKEVAVETPSADGTTALRLQLGARQEALQRLGSSDLSHEALFPAQTSQTAVERALLSILRSDDGGPDFGNRDQLVAWRTAATWLAKTGTGAEYTSSKVERQIDRLDYLSTMGGPDLQRFVGRESELAELKSLWRKDGSRTVLIEGPGGIGKSLLISRFIAGLLESSEAQSPDGFLVRLISNILSSDSSERPPEAIFHIDFDRPDLQRGGGSTILAEIARQAQRWLPASVQGHLKDIAAELRSGPGLESSSRRSRSSHRTQTLEMPARHLVSLLKDQMSSGPFAERRPRIILFGDTLERVIGFSDYAVHELEEVRDALRKGGAHVFAIYASRTFNGVGSTLPDEHVFRLTELPVADALKYLIDGAKRVGVEISREHASTVVEAVRGSPLALRLALSLLEKEGPTANPLSWVVGVSDSHDRIQAMLYDRILLRIRDEGLRKVAMPGFLVRRITATIISEVLAGPCRLDDVEPNSLMRMAEREGQLFQRDPIDRDAVWHRQDVRRLMLPDLERCIDPATALEINVGAVRHYERLDDITSRTEELYHRLRLDQSEQQIDARWSDEAGERLQSALEELPPRAQTYLRMRLGGAATASFSDQADRLGPNDPAVLEVRGVAERLLQRHDGAREAWSLLRSHRLDRLDGPLGDVVADLLVAERRFDFLFSEAERISAHSAGLDATIRAEILCTAAGVVEGLGQLEKAQEWWTRATLIDAADHTVLSGLLGMCRTERRMHGSREGFNSRAEREALIRARRLDKRLLELPVLARELVAELGARAELIAVDPRLFRAIVRRLLETGEAFPSAVGDSSRATQIGTRLVGRATTHLRELQELTSKLLVDVRGPNFEVFVDILREEVDWTLARVVTHGP